MQEHARLQASRRSELEPVLPPSLAGNRRSNPGIPRNYLGLPEAKQSEEETWQSSGEGVPSPPERTFHHTRRGLRPAPMFGLGTLCDEQPGIEASQGHWALSMRFTAYAESTYATEPQGAR